MEGFILLCAGEGVAVGVSERFDQHRVNKGM